MKRQGKITPCSVCLTVLLLFQASPVIAEERKAANTAEQGKQKQEDLRGRFDRNLDRWQSMSSKEQDEFRRISEHFKSLPPERREELKRRFAWYQKLPKPEKNLVRENFELVTQASEEEVAALQEIYKRYRELPPERQEKIEDFYHQWRQAPVEQQRLFLRQIRGAESYESAARIAEQWLEQAELRMVFKDFDSLPIERQETIQRRYKWYKGLGEREQQLVRSNVELFLVATDAELKQLKRLYEYHLKASREVQEEIKWFFRQWRRRSIEDQRLFLRRLEPVKSLEQLEKAADTWLRETKAVERPSPGDTRQRANSAVRQ